jgi:hypothetical protein
MNKYTKFNNQYGCGANYFRGAQFQRGYGFVNQVKKFFNWAWSLFKKHAVPKLEAGLKSIANETINSVSNIAKDAVAGKDIASSAKENINASINNIKDLTENKLNELSNQRGTGIKRKSSMKNFKSVLLFKKRKPDKRDIFS